MQIDVVQLSLLMNDTKKSRQMSLILKKENILRTSNEEIQVRIQLMEIQCKTF